MSDEISVCKKRSACTALSTERVSGMWSDRRCRMQSGKVVYFRARQRGACTYFDDKREGPLAHGLCWAPYCSDLQVVDVPGDHFSLLRQDEKDMSIIVDTLQMVLSAFGWHTTIKRDQKIYNKMNDVSFNSDKVFVQVQL